jgi:hypothetical protein
MPRWLAISWVIGVVVLAPVVMVASNFFIEELGGPAWRLIAFMIWINVSAASYFALWLFARRLLQKRRD